MNINVVIAQLYLDTDSQRIHTPGCPGDTGDRADRLVPLVPYVPTNQVLGRVTASRQARPFLASQFRCGGADAQHFLGLKPHRCIVLGTFLGL